MRLQTEPASILSQVLRESLARKVLKTVHSFTKTFGILIAKHWNILHKITECFHAIRVCAVLTDGRDNENSLTGNSPNTANPTIIMRKAALKSQLSWMTN